MTNNIRKKKPRARSVTSHGLEWKYRIWAKSVVITPPLGDNIRVTNEHIGRRKEDGTLQITPASVKAWITNYERRKA